MQEHDFMTRVFNMKKIFTYGACGVLVAAFMASFFYLHTSNPRVFPFRFVPNAVAYPKTRYVQVIDTERQLNLVKKSPIRDDGDEASVGSAISMGAIGLEVWSKGEVESPHYHLTRLSPQEDKTQMVDGYPFIPNAKLLRDPLDIEILLTPSLVDEAKRDKNITERDYAEIGAGVYCPKGARCFIIPKKNFTSNYEKIVSLYQS